MSAKSKTWLSQNECHSYISLSTKAFSGCKVEGFTLFPMESSASADGRILVRKIVEGQYEDAKLIISDQTLLAIQIVGDWDSCHPHVCWHSQIQVSVFSYWSSSLSN
jgi:hypothetical protein